MMHRTGFPARTGKLSQDIPAALRHFRKARGFTLKQVAGAMGTTPQTVHRLETGGMTVSLEWIDRLIAVLDIKAEDLLQPEDRIKIYADASQQIRQELATKLRHDAENLEKGNI